MVSLKDKHALTHVMSLSIVENVYSNSDMWDVQESLGETIHSLGNGRYSGITSLL